MTSSSSSQSRLPSSAKNEDLSLSGGHPGENKSKSNPMTPSSGSHSRLPSSAKNEDLSLSGGHPGENKSKSNPMTSSGSHSRLPSSAKNEDLSMSGELGGQPSSAGSYMGMEVDPPEQLTAGLAEALPSIQPRGEPTTGSSKPNAAAQSSDRVDPTKMSEKERRAWRLASLDQRRAERNARLRAEEAQKKLDQAKLEQDQPRPQTGDKRPRPAGNSPPPLQIASAMQEEMETDDPPPRDLSKIINLQPTKCAIQFKGGPIVGSPWGPQVGFGFSVSIDAGRFGEPLLTLDIRVAKGPKNVELGKLQREDMGYASISWTPGVTARESEMLTDFEAMRVADFPDDAAVSPPEIVKQLPKGKLTSLVCIYLNMRRLSLGPFEGLSIRGLKPEVTETLKALVDPTLSEDSALAMWCIPGQNLDSLLRSCFPYFAEAVRKRLIPLHQYCNEEGEPVLGIRTTEPLRTFGNGMYCKWGKQQNRNDPREVPNEYWQLPAKTQWSQLHQFHIYGDVAVVREAQYAEGQTALLQEHRHRIFLERMPMFHGVDPGDRKTWSKLTREQRRYRLSYYGYVRLTPDENSEKEQPPPVNSSVEVDFYNPDFSGVHQPIEGGRWFGTVISCEDKLLRQTGADFCILVTRPLQFEPKIAFDAPLYIQSQELPSAYIKVIFNGGPAVRELNAFDKFCSSSKPQIATLRQALWDKPRTGDRPVIDLSLGPDENPAKQVIWDSFNAWLDTAVSNEAQNAVIRSAKRMRDGHSVVVGPPGTGKTDCIQRLVWLLVLLGHTVMISASSNVAVDNAANAIYRNKRLDANGEEIKCLRLEIDTVELEASLLRGEYDDESDLAKPLEYNMPSHVDDPAIIHILEKMDSDYGAHQVDFEKYLQQEGNIEKAYRFMRERIRRMGGDYPRAYSLDWRLWDLCFRLRRKAQQEYDAEVAKYRSDPVGLSNLLQNGKIQNVDERDPSSGYRRYNEMYREKGGAMSRAAKGAYIDARREMAQMVIEESKIVLVSLNNSGCKSLRLAFRPTVMVVDEIGQASIAALSVPLTSFATWKGLFMFGDQEQLKPTVISVRANEAAEFAKLSPLHLLMEKGYEHIFLNMQYRMCPEISLFPARHFYQGKLTDAPITSQENSVRQAMRTVSKKHYNIRGRTGEGSEYWFVDVKNGMAWLEDRGSSLQNWANADAIIAAMDRCVSAGIAATDINVLTLYQGQRKLVLTKIRAKASADVEGTSPEEVQRKWAIGDVCTVDSFQGRQAPVVFLDIVASGNEKGAANDFIQSGGSFTYGHVTSFVRSPNRLNVAITRPQWGLIVFGKKASLITKNRPSVGDIKQSLALLVFNAADRKLIAEDTEHLDTHPTGVQLRKESEERAKAAQIEKDRIAKLSFIPRMQQQQHQGLASSSRPSDGQRGKKTESKAQKAKKEAEKKAAEDKANADKTKQYISRPVDYTDVGNLSPPRPVDWSQMDPEEEVASSTEPQGPTEGSTAEDVVMEGSISTSAPPTTAQPTTEPTTTEQPTLDKALEEGEVPGDKMEL